MSAPKTEFKFDLRHWLVGVNWDTTASPDGQTYFVAIHFGPLFWIRCWPKPMQVEIFPVGTQVSYLGECWTITYKAMPADVMHRRFMVLERINKLGEHERVEIEGRSWRLVTQRPSSHTNEH